MAPICPPPGQVLATGNKGEQLAEDLTTWGHGVKHPLENSHLSSFEEIAWLLYYMEEKKDKNIKGFESWWSI